MLFMAVQHSEIALIKYERQNLWTLPEQARCSCSVPLCCPIAARALLQPEAGQISYGYVFCSDHHQIDPAIFPNDPA